MLNKVDKRIVALAKKLAGDKFDIVQLEAEEQVVKGKSPERALADALEKFKLD